MLRIGHRGAAPLAPGPGLAVGHDRAHAGGLAGFLAEVSELAPPGLGFIVDLKSAGYEHGALQECRAAGIGERCVFSTGNMRSLAALNGHARTSATVAPGRWVPWSRVTPADIYLRSGARDATLRHDIVTSAAVAAVHRNGGRVYAWTVNTRAGIERMAALGCDGVITDDPRLFHEE